MSTESVPSIAALSQPTDGALSIEESRRFLGQVAALAGGRRRQGARPAGPAIAGVGAPSATDGARPVEARKREPDDIRMRLDELYTWQNEAMTTLQDLVAGRTALGSEGRALAAEARPEVTRAARRLVASLSRNAVQISALEGRRRRWHAAARAAREAIRLRGEVAAEATGAALRADAKAHLKLAHATFMLEGNSPRLRADLRAALDANPASGSLAYWTARYEIMAGNFTAAHEAALKAPNDHRIRNFIRSVLEPERTRLPQTPFPCNFYTYRYSLSDDDRLRTMQQALTELATDESLATQYASFLNDPETTTERLRGSAFTALRSVRALLHWNEGLRAFAAGRSASAERSFSACRREILHYFHLRYPQKEIGEPPEDDSSLDAHLAALAFKLIQFQPPTRHIWTHFRERLAALDLDELFQIDWVRPTIAPVAFQFYDPLPNITGAANFGEALILALIRLGIRLEILKAFESNPEKVEEKIDAPLLALALVFTSLAIAESNRLRRNYDAALSELRSLLRRHTDRRILCEFIEKPFAKILQAQVMLEKGDSEYKGRRTEDAATTYRGVRVLFEDQGEYVHRVVEGADRLRSEVQDLLAHSFDPRYIAERDAPTVPPPLDAQGRHRFEILGKDIVIPTVSSRTTSLAGLERRAGPHEPLLTFTPPDGQPVLRETNPLIYALILEAHARVLQIEAGFNYLGYLDSYVPPWRFRFLQERARYYAEHAKNAQREYLNFLSRAEQEEFQELSAAQNVVLEKANIRVETARVEQHRLEVAAAKQSQELAELTAQNAQVRANGYRAFDQRADELSDDIIGGANQQLVGSVGAGAFSGAAIGAAGGPIGAAAGAVIGGFFGFMSGSGAKSIQKAQLAIAAEQREFELLNLELAVGEAQQSAQLATSQLAVTGQGLVIAGLQRGVALLRHEFAVQNLAFLRNRTLNAELWYRLAHQVRGVSETYLRYAVELAFLAEQAYEFEADRRINVIRFDYDASDLGEYLAADFLLRDLDTLEQDLLVSHREKQQQLRYVLSLAREFPEALQELRVTGRTTISLRLDQLERRFPGLYNLRLGSVEVLPVALMDPTRFSLELTYTGTGQVRLRAQPDTPPGEVSETPYNTSDLPIGSAEWPVKVRLTGPETAVFSGLTAQERAVLFPFISANQRNVFENLAAAATLRIDMSMRENQVVPGTLADLLITCNLSGFHDAGLRALQEASETVPRVLTQWLSAHQTFPDAFYEFHQSGRMRWDVTADLLGLAEAPGALRNVAMLLLPASRVTHFDRLAATHVVKLRATADGQIELLSSVPEVSLSTDQLTLSAQAQLPPGASAIWDFGDGSGPQDGTAQVHTYQRPGRYDTTLRVIRTGRLEEFRASVAVSSNHPIVPPLTAFPAVAVDPNPGEVPPGQVPLLATTRNPAGEALDVVWQLDQRPAVRGDSVGFSIEPGTHTLTFTAIRRLTARVTAHQRFDPDQTFPVSGLRLGTNRVFASDGTETTTDPNALTTHLFTAGPLSPLDSWTLEVSIEDNPFLRTVTTSDAVQFDLDGIEDAVLAMEYES